MHSRRRPAALFVLLLAPAACGERRGDPIPPASVDSSSDFPADTAAGAGPAGAWPVGLRAAGPLRYGASLADARRATGDSLADAVEGEGCAYVSPRAAPAGMRFMVENGRVVRVDVDSAGVATDRGARIGMREDDIRRLHGDGIAVRPHKYEPDSRYLIVVPRAPADSAFRIVFETDGAGVVRRYRAGMLPAVEYVEGCG